MAPAAQDVAVAAKKEAMPLVDLGALLSDKHDEEVEKAKQGWLDWGFVEFVNHGIPDEVFDEAFSASKEFFSFSMEEKNKTYVELEGRVALYQPGFKGDVRTVDGIRRQKEHFHFVRLRKPGQTMMPDPNAPIKNVWPETPANFRPSIERMHEELTTVVDHLTDVFSESLGLEKDLLRKRFFIDRKNNVSARPAYMHHYLQSESAEVDAVPPHEDGSVFTIVVQANYGVDGLQVLRNDEFCTIVPHKYGLLVNSGDVMKVWSNGDFKSMTHRVRNNKAGSRFTIAYFVIPPQDLIVEPITERLPEGVAPKYAPFVFSELAQIKKKLPDAKHVEAYEKN